MKQYTTIAVIGGTGKAGKYLVNQLVQRGFRLKLLIRNPETFQLKNPLIQVVEGNANNATDIHLLMQGCNTIISTLGLGQPSSETNIFSESTKNILLAMTNHQIQRYIVITGLNVNTPFDKKSPKTQFATDWMYANYPKTTADKQTEYDILSSSNVDWTLVRLPLIEQTDEKGNIKVSLEDCLEDKISATNLAEFLIEQLTDDRFIKQAPFIANS
ncbi:NAD(P)H-binding protein [Arcicella sp. LKC2W]|uniref:NAD(P)-dependent oxidoreductase n=1 Tax=Arcicella sp. LKC2W TaxID=2984198 RepID=UPI002B21B986|nr:NAD(P)H-binding protein [Arcicella sp. LKC2W]MEA5459389.1 NAD(P)H-binding protein [Arcicella sp. LKC2W]